MVLWDSKEEEQTNKKEETFTSSSKQNRIKDQKLNQTALFFDGMRDTVDATTRIRATMLENGWRKPRLKFSEGLTTTDALTMFREFDNEIREASSSPSLRSTNAFYNATNGVVYMATSNTRFIDRAAMVASRMRGHSKRSKFRTCLYTDKALYEEWLEKLKLTKTVVETYGWGKVKPTDAGGWIFTKNARKNYMRVNPFDDVVFYDGLSDLLADEEMLRTVEKKLEKQRRSGKGTNLPLYFFLKKIVSLVGAPYTKMLFADGDTCSCGDYINDVFEELDGKFNKNKVRIQASNRIDGRYDFMHTIDPARNQGGNHLGYDLRDFYKTRITFKEARFRRVGKSFEERNVGFIVYRPNELTTLIFRHFAELLLGAINLGTLVRNEQPAYTEALWIWRKVIRERIMNNRNDVCRKLTKYEKERCIRLPSQKNKLLELGPLCRRGCRFAHEKCECWRNRVLTMDE